MVWNAIQRICDGKEQRQSDDFFFPKSKTLSVPSVLRLEFSDMVCFPRSSPRPNLHRSTQFWPEIRHFLFSFCFVFSSLISAPLSSLLFARHYSRSDLSNPHHHHVPIPHPIIASNRPQTPAPSNDPSSSLQPTQVFDVRKFLQQSRNKDAQCMF